VLISKRNNENTVCFSRLSFEYVVYVLYITLFTSSADMQVDFAVFKFLEKVRNSDIDII